MSCSFEFEKKQAQTHMMNDACRKARANLSTKKAIWQRKTEANMKR
jgi:hypothetical protein